MSPLRCLRRTGTRDKCGISPLTASDTSILIKASFAKPLAGNAFVTDWRGATFRGRMNDTEGAFWQLFKSHRSATWAAIFFVDSMVAANHKGAVPTLGAIDVPRR